MFYNGYNFAPLTPSRSPVRRRYLLAWGVLVALIAVHVGQIYQQQQQLRALLLAPKPQLSRDTRSSSVMTWSTVLIDVAQHLPAQTYLQSIDLQSDQAQLQGICSNWHQLDHYVRQLRELSWVERSRILSSQMQTSHQGIAFTIQLQVALDDQPH